MYKSAPLNCLKYICFFGVLLCAPFASFSQNNCASPATISSLPYSQSGLSTCGRGNTYSTGNCLTTQYFGGEDYVLRYTPSASGCIAVTVDYTGSGGGGACAATTFTYSTTPVPPAPYQTTNALGDCYCRKQPPNNPLIWNCSGSSTLGSAAAGVAVFSACPDAASSCLGFDTETSSTTSTLPQMSVSGIAVTAGTPYYILVSSGSLTPTCGTFTINVTSVNCPPPPLPTTPQGVDCGNNLGFESGNLTGWTGYTKPVANQSAPCCPVNPTTPGLVSGGLGTCATQTPSATTGRHTITSGAGTDPNSDGQITVVAPGGKNNSVRIGNHEAGWGSECMENTFTVSASAPLFTYMYAVVLQDPGGHTTDQRPRFEITIKNNGNLVSCGGSYAIVSNGAAADGFIQSTTGCGSTTGDPPWYKKWTAVGTDLTPYIGQQVTVKFCSADCGLGGHYGYAYVDTYCNPKDISGAVICTVSGTATLIAPAGYQGYTWYKAGDTVGTSVGTGSSLVVSNANDGDLYTVKFQSITGSACWSKVTDTIRVIDASIKPDTSILCNGSSGTMTLKASSNDPSATYSWTSNPAGFTSSQQNPVANIPSQTTVYTVTVNSPLGCTLTKSTTVTIQPCATTAVATGAQICRGSCATVSVSGSGGTPPYTYAWSGGLGTNQTPLVCPTSTTTYTVTVTDNTGSTATDTAIVTVNQPPTATTSSTNSLCFGLNSGTATVTAAAGTPTYTYEWDGGAGLTPSLTGLSPGSFTVTVTDSKGCTVTATTSLTEPPALTVTHSLVDVLCSGDNTGSITVTAGGGTPGYTYSWTPASGTSPTASNLTAGVYAAVITDANSCTITDTVTITEPPPLTIAISGTNISCFNGTDGTATVTAGGGTPGYTYGWTPAAGNDSIALNLPAQPYTVTVTDANSCTITANITPTQPPAIVPTITTTPVSCFNGTDGTATATATGGTPGYTYAWTANGTNAILTGKTAGDYTVTVTDTKNCTATATGTITQPTEITLTTSVTDATCGTTDGSATVTPSGGTPGYTYIWAVLLQTDQTATAIGAGNYTVTVTDTKNCTKSVVVGVSNPGVPIIGATGTNISCAGGSDGTATVSIITGSTPPYSYTWNTPNSDTTDIVSGLSQGTYNVEVRDAGGCLKTTSVILTEPPPIVLTTSAVNSNCGASDGSATVNATGGTPGYTYSWNSLPGVTTSVASNIPAGTYTVTVTDSKLCTKDTTIIVNDIGAAAIAIDSVVDVKCSGGNNGVIAITATGGIQPYTYAWTPVVTTVGDTLVTGLIAGIYTVTVTSANGCSVTQPFTITEPTPIVLSTSVTDANCGASDGSATVSATGGTPGYTYNWTTSPSQATPVAAGIPAGSYTVTVTDANGCITSTATSVSDIGAPSATTSVTPVSCFGGSDGTATVTASGGVPTYTYSWSGGGGTNPVATGLAAGTYTVTVTGANNCKVYATANITEPPDILLTTSVTNEICSRANATATVTAAGGVGGFVYSWATPPGGATTSITGLTAGGYTVTVTDANNCSKIISTSMPNIPGPTANFNPSDACINVPIAFNDASTAGGAAINAWSWSFGDGASSANQNDAHAYSAVNTYNVTLLVTDQNGCTDTVTKPVTIFPDPVVDFTGNDGCEPLAVTFANLSTPPGSTYLWNFGTTPTATSTSATPTFTYTKAGTYDVTLTVTSPNGCTKTLTKPGEVVVYPIPLAEFSMQPEETSIYNPVINFFDQSQIAATWNWHFGDGDTADIADPVHEYKATGTYDVTLDIVSPDGCPASVTHQVKIKPDWAFWVPNAFTPNNDGINDTFNGKGYGITEYKMLIYDRWGNRIFESESLNFNWDGRANGGSEIAQEDVYVYLITLKNIFNEGYRYVGSVTLIK